MKQAHKWIKHNGGPCPVTKGTLVDVRFRDGDVTYGQPALEKGHPDVPWAEDWSHTDHPADIVSYRLCIKE